MNTLEKQIKDGYPFYKDSLTEMIYLALEEIRLQQGSRYASLLTVVGSKVRRRVEPMVLAPLLAQYGLAKFVGSLLSQPEEFYTAFENAVRFLTGTYKTLH